MKTRLKNWTRGWIITECICGLVAVILSVWIGVNMGNSDWFNKPDRATRYSPIIITPEVMAEAGTRFTDGVTVINNEGKKLRDAIGQQRDINDFRLWREMRVAEEKAFLERMSPKHKDLK